MAVESETFEPAGDREADLVAAAKVLVDKLTKSDFSELMTFSRFPPGCLETLALATVLISPLSVEELGFQTPFDSENHRHNRSIVMRVFHGDTNGALRALYNIPEEVRGDPGTMSPSALEFVRSAQSSSPSMFNADKLGRCSSMARAMCEWVDIVMQLHGDAPFRNAVDTTT